MSRLPKLYALLSSLVAASTMACGPCPPAEEDIILIDPEAETLRESFERCQLDALDCEDLCRSVYKLMYGPGTADYVYFDTCELVDVDGADAVHYVVTHDCVGGRLPSGAQLEDSKCATSEAGAWFAKLAELEEASVYAFAMLSAELARLGAPAELSKRCLDAAVDEIQHARLVGGLARRFGAEVSPIAKPKLLVERSLREVAVENAREGCVRETFGALVAVYQAQHSSDPIVRQVMHQISIDESRHAELSAAIDSWARSVLDSEARAELDRSRREAIAELREGASAPVTEELVDRVGLPNALASTALFRHAEATIWA